jgi:D-glycero-D-manno-heptose 1,7-bisphosphate phosphatase
VADELSPAVFLDRDGTLMRDVDYCCDPKDVHLFPGTAEALRKLKQAGYKLIIITNQSAIGRGYFNESAYRAVEREVIRQLGDELIDGTYFCPHVPDDQCECRKPQPGMILQAARDHRLDLGQSFFIGDKESDVECGRNAGVKAVLVRTGYGTEADAEAADIVAKDLEHAADLILRAKLGENVNRES